MENTMRLILIALSFLLVSCVASSTPIAAQPTPTPNPYATWTPTPGMGAQGVIIQQTAVAFEMTRGAYSASLAQATQSAQATANTQALKERELMLRVTEQTIAPQAKQNDLAFEMTKAAATQQGRAVEAATLKQKGDDEWWWWVKSFAAIVIIGALGWCLISIGEAWRYRMLNDIREVRMIRSREMIMVAKQVNGAIQTEWVQLDQPNAQMLLTDGSDAPAVEFAEETEAAAPTDNAPLPNQVVYKGGMSVRKASRDDREFIRKFLTVAINLAGKDATWLPPARDFDPFKIYSDDWKEAKKILKGCFGSDSTGTWIAHQQYKTLGELFEAVRERRLTLHSPTPKGEGSKSGVLQHAPAQHSTPSTPREVITKLINQELGR
jgi:hypothetical protein